MNEGDRMGEVRIPSRFNGPESSANGGYACGTLARFVDGPAEVTLRLPPPLETPMAVLSDGAGGARMLHGEDLVAEAKPVDGVDAEPPIAPSFDEALAARERHPKKGVVHPMSGCFVCGPERGENGDGLWVTPGPYERAEDADAGGAPFVPDQSVLAGGVVDPAIVWSVLDCPSYTPSMWLSDKVAMLGRLAAQIDRDVEPGERLVTVGWMVSSEGRKRNTASAILDESGGVVARAAATWIELKAPQLDG